MGRRGLARHRSSPGRHPPLCRAKITWEQIRSRRPNDVEANLALATVYQRLGDLTSSSAAILRAAERADLPASRRAEALALRGST